MKKITVIACAAFLLLSSPLSAQSASSCDSFANTMTKRALAVFHDASLNEGQKRQALSALFQEAVDTDWIAKFVLGRYWKTAAGEEQQQYLQRYRAYLTAIYISKFKDEDGMNVDDIKVASLTPQQPGEYQAKTLIQNKGEDDVHVDYLLDGSSGKCQVHDIIVEGVSLLTSQRSEFGTLAGSAGIQGVIAAMDRQLHTQ